MLSLFLDIRLIQGIALTVSLTLAVLIMLINVPKTEYAKKLTRAKTTIATNFLVGAFVFGYTLYHSDLPDYGGFSVLTTLIIAAFSSILMSYSLINLMQPRYIDSGRFMISVFILFVVSALLTESFFSDNALFHKGMLVTAIILFVIQNSYLIIIFDKAYRKSLELLEKYYDEDEEHKVKWIRFCYILTMLTTMFVLIYMFLPQNLIIIYNFFYILYMVYFAGNFISFLGSHKLLLDAFGHSAFSEQRSFRKKKTAKERKHENENILGGLNTDDVSSEFSAIETSLKKWVSEKKYREYDKSREETAHEIGTTREMLQLYFSEKVGEDFRTWRTRLRINDAKQMLLEKKETSINLIGEIAGFSDRSNFHRQFTKFVGCTPKKWRDTAGNPDAAA